MPRKTSLEKKIRLNLEVTEKTHDRIDRIRKLSEAETITEAIRRAVEVYEFFLKEQYSGTSKLLLRRADGTEILVLMY